MCFEIFSKIFITNFNKNIKFFIKWIIYLNFVFKYYEKTINNEKLRNIYYQNTKFHIDY